MFKTMFMLLAVAALAVGCSNGPTSELLEGVADKNNAMILTDQSSNVFVAVHWSQDKWTLHPVTEP